MIMKEKVAYLLEMGFSPMTDSPNNTLFKKGSYIITVQSDMTIDELKKEVSSYMKIHDIIQRDEFQKKQEEPAEAQAASESSGAVEKQEVNMSITVDDVKKLAKLSRLEFNMEQEKNELMQLSSLIIKTTLHRNGVYQMKRYNGYSL